MRIILFILLSTFIASCEKSNDSKTFDNYGCAYGVKDNGDKVFLGCWHREIYNVAGNQAAADKVADQYGIPRVSVAAAQYYPNRSFAANEKCDCQ